MNRQHQRPIGPTGTNTQAPFTSSMVAGYQPPQPRLRQRPPDCRISPQGWQVSQTTHVQAAFTNSMIDGNKPDRTPRPHRALYHKSGQQLSQTTHVQAAFSVEMIQGARPFFPVRSFKAPIGWSVSQTTHVQAAFSIEMVGSSRPTGARFPKYQRTGTQVAQLTAVATATTKNYYLGGLANANRLGRGFGWAG